MKCRNLCNQSHSGQSGHLILQSRDTDDTNRIMHAHTITYKAGSAWRAYLYRGYIPICPVSSKGNTHGLRSPLAGDSAKRKYRKDLAQATKAAM